jgi:hypothetical protein
MHILSHISLLILLVGATRALPIGSRDAAHIAKRADGDGDWYEEKSLMHYPFKLPGNSDNLIAFFAISERSEGLSICKKNCTGTVDCGGILYAFDEQTNCGSCRTFNRTRMITIDQTLAFDNCAFHCRNIPDNTCTKDFKVTTPEVAQAVSTATTTNSKTPNEATDTFVESEAKWDYTSQMNGNVLNSKLDTIEKCRDGCVYNPECVGYAWISKKKSCWLKLKNPMQNGADQTDVKFFCRSGAGSTCETDDATTTGN